MLSRLFPGLLWLQGYDRSAFRSDLFSGVTIAAMLIPQSMGYAVVAGLPAEYGLYACIVPPIIYALLGTSNKISIGPVALDAILILSGLSAVADPGNDNYLHLAIALTLMVGLIQLFFGLIKFGFIANFLSHPVILGYTSAAAVIIICSQLESVVGVSVPAGNPVSLLMAYGQRLMSWHWLTLAIGLLGMAVLIVPGKIFPNLPYGLILLLLGMFFSGLWGARDYGVDVIAAVPAGVPLPRVPEVTAEQLVALLPTALTVALMGYVGSMSICKAQEEPADKHTVRPNRELVAMGLANIAGSLFRAFPVSASFSRSAAFVAAGARTQLSAVVSALVIALVLICLTPLFNSYPLPKVLLSVIIISSVAGLFKYGQMKALYRQNTHEFLLMLVTFLITLMLGVQYGLFAGVALSIARVIYNSANPHMTELGAIQDGRLFRNVDRFDDVAVREDVLIFRFDAPIYFANKDYLVEHLHTWLRQREPGRLKAIILNAESVSNIDSSGILMLLKLIQNLEGQGITFYLTNVIGPVRDELAKSPIQDYLCEDRMFPTIHDALEHIDYGIGVNDTVALQTNH